jgi:hypothetical protein
MGEGREKVSLSKNDSGLNFFKKFQKMIYGSGLV